MDFGMLALLGIGVFGFVLLLALGILHFRIALNPQRQLDAIRRRQGLDPLAGASDRETYLRHVGRTKLIVAAVCAFGAIRILVFSFSAIFWLADLRREILQGEICGPGGNASGERLEI